MIPIWRLVYFSLLGLVVCSLMVKCFIRMVVSEIFDCFVNADGRELSVLTVCALGNILVQPAAT